MECEGNSKPTVLINIHYCTRTVQVLLLNLIREDTEENIMCDDYNISKLHVKMDYMEAYDFEVFDTLGVNSWFRTHRHILYLLLSLYLLGIYFGRRWMKNRPPYKLNRLLFIWNLGLAIFSILATIRGFPEAFYLLSQPDGIYLATCSGESAHYATVFWGLLFTLSKFVEFGDTAFIVLRKQKLIVLHWFHHVSVGLGCWLAVECIPAVGRLYFVNTFVHSFMYTYYAAKALKIKIPRMVSMALTLLQIFQMICGVTIFFSMAYTMRIGRPCRLNMEILYLGVGLISTFLVLFINFFIRNYFQSKSAKIE